MNNMKHLTPFEWTGETFEERIGEPEAFEAAVGRIATNFSDLEHTLNRLIHGLTKLRPGCPIAAPRFGVLRYKSAPALLVGVGAMIYSDQGAEPRLPHSS